VETSRFSGFLDMLDAGVPDRTSFNFTGIQYDFNPNSQFVTNDEPGHGASTAYNEGKVIAGNMFDYPYVHGVGLRAAGLSFVSVSRAAVTDSTVSLSSYRLVDLILGKQRTTRWQKGVLDSLRGFRFEAFPAPFREKIASYCRGGGSLFVSGAYVASDLMQTATRDTTATIFAKETLHFGLGATHASKRGGVFSVQPAFLPAGEWTAFNEEATREMYGLESVDALAALNGGKVVLRYSENEFGAGVTFNGGHRVVALGFPFEAVPEASRRECLMKAAVSFLLSE
jgi:hypothetical protein